MNKQRDDGLMNKIDRNIDGWKNGQIAKDR